MDRDFTASAPNQKWATDITYVHARGGLYLAVMQDLYSSRVVGWAINDYMKGALSGDALRMVLTSRGYSITLMHHHVRGSQYTSYSYQALLKDNEIQCSMSRRGQWWDNATAESFFGRLKEEVFLRFG